MKHKEKCPVNIGVCFAAGCSCESLEQPYDMKESLEQLHAMPNQNNEATLTQCQCSVKDYECTHPICPMLQPNPPTKCPLPWHGDKWEESIT